MTTTSNVNTQIPTIPGSTTPTSGTGTSSSGTGSNADAASIGKTFDQFLTLLTTQLKNQDPLSPEDSTQFTSQLVQFSQVEQAIDTNTKLDTLIATNQSSQLLQASNFIGKSVEVAGNSVNFDGKDPVGFGYTVNGTFSTAQITITDDNGNVVRQTPITLTTGHNVLSWDGSDPNGATLPAGKYTLNLQAFDANGGSVDVTQSVVGTVTDVSLDNGTTQVQVDGGTPTPLSSILSVRS